jgi:hypothetical protein
VKKKIGILLIVLVLLNGIVLNTYAADLGDVKGNKYEDSILKLMKLGIINGNPDGEFKPGDTVTRAQFAKLISTALGLETAKATANTESARFSDVGTDCWAYGYIATAQAKGLIVGRPDGTFGPNDSVTYAQAITVLMRSLGFNDSSLPGSWPTNFMKKAAEIGVTNGVSALNNEKIKRDFAAKLLDNTLDTGLEWNKYFAPSYRQDNGNMLSKGLHITPLTGTVELTPSVSDGLESNSLI